SWDLLRREVWARVSGRSSRGAVFAEFDVDVRREEPGRPVPCGQAAPGVVDQGDDSGEQALSLESPIREVADGLALEVIELIQEVGSPRVGVRRGVGIVL